MIEMFLDILMRMLQNQNATMYAELKNAEEEEARKLLSESINLTCALLDAIITFRKEPGEEPKDVIELKEFL